jgi:hypothetical protein
MRSIKLLKRGLERLGTGRVPSRHALALPGQPFDAWLLSSSSLYRRSRKLYLEQGGKFRAQLQSTPRSLSSAALLYPRIDYSPIEAELVWAATDRYEKRTRRLHELRTLSSSLFHEQNHRVLWALLPPAPRGKADLRRYLNLAEALIIAADMALGDELTPAVAGVFYQGGVIYDPGTRVRTEGRLSRREYRNYLQAALHATYLCLEGFEPRDLPRAMRALFPGPGPLAARAAHRAGQLDSLFIRRTNQIWQRRHRAEVLRRLSRGPARKALVLPSSPMDNRQAYLIGERWFELLGL